MFIHGGAFTIGASTDIPPDQVHYLLSQGIVVISVEYRLLPHVRSKDIRQDLLDAYIWIQKDLNGILGLELDTERIALFGWSGGATSITFLVRAVLY